MLNRVEGKRGRSPLTIKERTCDDIMAPGVERIGEDAFLWFREEVFFIVQAGGVGGDENGFSLQAG